MLLRARRHNVILLFSLCFSYTEATQIGSQVFWVELMHTAQTGARIPIPAGCTFVCMKGGPLAEHDSGLHIYSGCMAAVGLPVLLVCAHA